MERLTSRWIRESAAQPKIGLVLHIRVLPNIHEEFLGVDEITEGKG